jgi:protein phosphatase
MAITIHYDGRTDVGRLRRRNEDAWGAAALEDCAGGCLLLVADGMGGHPGGDVASRLAVEAGLEEARRTDSPRAGGTRLAEIFRAAHDRLREHARFYPGMAGMGTTLTALLVQDDGAWVGNIGDSRLLWHRNGELRLLTEDHNAAWELVVAGYMDADEAERAPEGALLTRFLGATTPCQPDISERPLELLAGDRLLLCTDGLGKALTMKEIAGLASEALIGRAVSQAIERALAAGAPDNVTVLLAEVVQAPEIGGPSIGWETVSYRWGSGGGEAH